MGLPRDDHVADSRTRRRPMPAQRFGAGEGEVVPFRGRGESVAQRLEREWAEQERAERARREEVERRRIERDRAIERRLEERRRARLESLRQERQRKDRRERYVWSRRRRTESAPPRRGHRVEPKPAPEPARARIDPGVKGPVRKRQRAAENRRRASTRRRGLFWPTAKVGFAVTMMIGLGAGLGSLVGLPVPGLDAGPGHRSLASSAAIFGVDSGTPQGLSRGYVFPLLGPHDFGDGIARFGAPRYGHIHEGQAIS